MPTLRDLEDAARRELDRLTARDEVGKLRRSDAAQMANHMRLLNRAEKITEAELRARAPGRPAMRGANIIREATYSEETGRKIEDAVLRCGCGRAVTLDDPMTNTCDCGQEYNGSGQHLAPRSQWGEETGESLADILGPYTSTRYGDEMPEADFYGEE